MFRARNVCARISPHFNLLRTRPFCSAIKDSNNSKKNNDVDANKAESNPSAYNESYRQLDNLDFTTAAKILFTDPPKKKKFGLDFHLVQLFFVCMPSLAVYLVAQYARHEMRKMDAELEEKKKKEEEAKKKQKEEEKAKEMELRGRSDPELLEVKERLGKLEEAIKEIVVESKKESADSITKSQLNGSKHHEAKSTSESSSSMEQDKLTKEKPKEQTPSSDPGKVRSAATVSDASQNDQKGGKQNGGTSQE
ncbi:hypothetical protein COLO4_26669 [Corchorus olitorius]|uniref:Uncharacterized protein n=1 Tax=Corchorus olitorius TaxID=93759 RepID=A0A1R3HUY5_9ROSI|nr:hypothetical protein COLO4_26669 [Corchorus olitorius]